MQGLSGIGPVLKKQVMHSPDLANETSRTEDSEIMSTKNLHEEITQLRRDLQNLDEVDDATREELSKLERRIEDLLDEGNEEETVPEKVISHLEESATQFAVQHPKAEGLLRRIAYALGRMGI